MKTIFMLLTLGATLAGVAAQAPTETPRRSGRPGPVLSPEVREDGRVTFRLRAPNASEVVVNGQWPDGRQVMAQSEGTWSVTVGPVPAGVWEYSFLVDGLAMIDPGNPEIKPMRQPRTSILHIPGDPPKVHDFQEVPHGAVVRHAYFSKALDRRREVEVYTPPGYERTDATFPVLYLQHGAGDNESTWTVHGKAHWILDNLIAQGRAVPMLVVMMDGHAATGGGRGGFQSNTSMFERDLLEEVLPFVERSYRVRPGREHRAIAGLSMGGGQSLTIGLKHSDRFGWVGGFSSAVPSSDAVREALEDAKRTNENLELLWIACGKDDFLLQRNEAFIETLTEKDIQHEWVLTEGNHSWPVWRGYLAEFAPKLFRGKQ